MAIEPDTAFAVWIVGLPASGKSTLAASLEQQLRDRRMDVTVLESDALRRMLPLNSTYDDQDRQYFYASLCFIARALTEHGVSVILDATAHLRAYRQCARREIPRFLEVFVDTPLAVCMERDPKGIYRMALAGSARYVPGLQVPFEPPESPDIVVRGDRETPESAARRVMNLLEARQFIKSE